MPGLALGEEEDETVAAAGPPPSPASPVERAAAKTIAGGLILALASLHLRAFLRRPY